MKNNHDAEKRGIRESGCARLTPSMKIQPYRKDLESELITLVAECYAEYDQVIELESLDSDLMSVDEIYRPPFSTFQVLLDGRQLVGSVAVKGKQGGNAELKRLFLERSYRRRGFGKYLSLWAFDWARRSGYDMITIWTDALYTNAHRLYHRLEAVQTDARRELGGVNMVEEIHFEYRLSKP